jgi:putative ABC transport system ATP-binding protein
VIVPADALVDIDASTGIGTVRVLGRTDDDVDARRHVTGLGNQFGPISRLEVRTGIANVEVVRSARMTRTGRRHRARPAARCLLAHGQTRLNGRSPRTSLIGVTTRWAKSKGPLPMRPPGPYGDRELNDTDTRRTHMHTAALSTPVLDTQPAPAIAAARAEGARKIYGRGNAQVAALDGVTVEFVAGQFTAIMGPSGSGKSTLMHCLAGLDTLSTGRVFLGDTNLTGLDDRRLTQLRRDKVGFVFQAFNLVPTLTAVENIVLPATLAGRKVDADWLELVVRTVGLESRLLHRPSELSGGQQQRVAVARALSTRPEIIFGDEPTGNLDSRSGAEVLAFLRRAVDDFGQTIVMVTHDPVAAGHADRVVFLADGRIVDEMTAPTASRVLDHMKRLGD